MTYIISSGPSPNLDLNRKAGDPEDIQLPSNQPRCSPFQIRFSFSERVLFGHVVRSMNALSWATRAFCSSLPVKNCPHHDIR